MLTHLYGLVLTGPNCAFALGLTIIILTMGCLLHSLVGVVELSPADAITVFGAIVKFLLTQLFYGLKDFCNNFKSHEKLLLIFFCSSNDLAAANSLRKLLCFFASNTWKMLSFSISLNFFMHSSVKVLASFYNLNNQ